MFSSQNQKNKINLSDYDIKFDLSKRFFLSKLSVFEIEVLKEIVHNSLKFSISELCETLEAPSCLIEEALLKLQSLELFTLHQGIVRVNKEFRKYFEVQIERFKEDFKPDNDYFYSLLHLIPIEIIPNWFCISKSSDDIFQSITDSFFLTPQLFQRYLLTLQFDDPNITKVMELVYMNQDLHVDVHTIMKKISIDRVELEKILIVLELHKVCCLKYLQKENDWLQIVTPFNEWAEYCRFKESFVYKPIENPAEVVFEHGLSYSDTIDQILTTLLKTPLTQDELNKYPSQFIDKIISLQLADFRNSILHPSVLAAEWLRKSHPEKCMAIYFLTFNLLNKNKLSGFTEKDIREIEKAIKTIIDRGWVYLDDFLLNLCIPIGSSKQITLQKKGKKWSYAFPEYDANQKSFILKVLEEHLFPAGMIYLGTYQGKKCLLVTPFGKASLGE